MNKKPDAALPPEVTAALERGQVIEAIKLLRQAKGLGLKEAKEAVDAVKAGAPMASAADYSSDGLAPGEQRQHTGLWVALIVALLLGLLVWRWVGN
jgi:hypothetical protein